MHQPSADVTSAPSMESEMDELRSRITDLRSSSMGVATDLLAILGPMPGLTESAPVLAAGAPAPRALVPGAEQPVAAQSGAIPLGLPAVRGGWELVDNPIDFSR